MGFIIHVFIGPCAFQFTILNLVGVCGVIKGQTTLLKAYSQQSTWCGIMEVEMSA